MSQIPVPPPVRPKPIIPPTVGPAKAVEVKKSVPQKTSAQPQATSPYKKQNSRGGRPAQGRRPGGRGKHSRERSSGVHFGPPRNFDMPLTKQPPRNPDGMYVIPLGGL